MFAQTEEQGDNKEDSSEDQTKQLQSGALCPKCKQGLLDYDGLLNLSCGVCGFQAGGCFT